MAGTFSKLYAHVVFSVRNRQKLLRKSFQPELYKYIAGIVENKGQKLIRINGTDDHLHLLISYNPIIAVSDLVRDIKANSSKLINERKLVPGRFEWQEGYSIFSCDYRNLDGITSYIEQQEEHHRKRTFREEYIDFLKSYDIDYNEKYVYG